VDGATLALFALPAAARPSAVRPLWLLACASVAILCLGVDSLVDSAPVAGVPEARSWEARLLHDIGKRATPTEILHKPGRFTDAEFTELSLHPPAR
jgi:hypothetical protein